MKLVEKLLVATVTVLALTACDDSKPKMVQLTDDSVTTCDIYIAHPEKEFLDVPKNLTNYDYVGVRGYPLQFNVDGELYLSSNYTINCGL